MSFGLHLLVKPHWSIKFEDNNSNQIFPVYCKFQVVEGSAGVAVAAYMKNQNQFTGQSVVLVSCGSNISTATLKKILNTYEKD